ncbi:MAG TPA: DUF4112 domain-containing protein [Cyanobacteria bacterium UBA8803]|nr:DUF4112 domain-containing protein [Cyanobacteria bacterium UBA9273]HBL60007.1 DUF4112 domain-containing protein [Cyanobacteria bacterium UBA8803]
MSQFSQQPPRVPLNAKTSTLQRLRRLSYLLDNAIPIPGTPYRIGLDPLLGILPGGGDFVGTILSAYIVIEAARLGLPRSTLTKMVGNIVFETVFGAVPVVGDLVDATWKSNARNMAILEEHLEVPKSQKHSDWLFLALLLGGLFLVVVAIAAIGVLLLTWLVNAIAR